MKLVLAIVNNDDSAVVASALTQEGFFVTKLSTTGGFLMVGNATLLIGTQDDKTGRIKEILKKYCSTRKQLMILLHIALCLSASSHILLELPRSV